MKALHIHKYGRLPKLVEIPIPKITKPSEVLVRMKYAPINPSDINFFQGRYGLRKEGFPIVGFQGSGIIQQAQNKEMVGKKVSVLAGPHNGTHATHLVSEMKNLIVWDREIDAKAISMVWINPISCLGLYQIIQKNKFQTVLLSAAASQLNSMMIQLIKIRNPSIKVYGITRKPDHNQSLLKKGFSEIFSTDDDLSEKLKNFKTKTAFLDCIAGQFAGKIFNNLPEQSMLVSYGRLSGEPITNIDTGSLYYKDKSIRGFWLNNWLKEVSDEELEEEKKIVKDHFESVFEQRVRKTFKIEDFDEAYRSSIKNQSDGKILFDFE